MLANPANQTERLTAEDIFGPYFDDGIIELQYELRTPRSKQFFKRDFVYLSQLLYSLARYRAMRIPGPDGQYRDVNPGALDAVEANLNRKIDGIREFLTKKAREAAALLEANGHSDMAIKYSQPVVLSAPIIAPMAREFMEILQVADDTFAKVQACYLLGLLNPATKVKVEFECRRVIRALSPTVRLHRIKLGQLVQQMRENATPEAAKLIGDVVAREFTTLISQGAEEPDIKGSVSDESDLERMASAAAAAADRTPISPDLDASPSAAGTATETESSLT
jgi:hypothetical protein